jgi:type IV fimbrial biogenesis protein FimT
MEMHKHEQKQKPRQQGLTLTELLISIAIIAVMMLLALPSFSSISKNGRIRTQINDFHFSLLQARSEAITRISRITVCRSRDGASCAATSWAQGWIVFTDGNSNAGVDAGEEILHVHEALEGGTSLVGNRPVASYISYIGNGRTRRISGSLQMGTVVLCDDRGFGKGKAIVFNAAGRPSVRDAEDSSFDDCTIP